MAGLAIKVSSDFISEPSKILKYFKDIYKLNGTEYNETGFTGERYAAYNCFPAFLNETKAAEIENHLIIFDGDFYNLEELGRYLNLKTKSKTLLLYSLFKKCGESFALHLNGEFVVIIYNIAAGDLLITNDRFARKPFFYFHDDKEIIAGSEKKVILSELKSLKLDYAGLLQVFALGHNINQHTFIKNIFALPHASILKFNKGNFTLKSYYEWKYTPDSLSRYKMERVAELNDIFTKAVNIRVKDKERIAILLSGGYDSRGVACAVNPKYRSKISANTFGVDDSPELEIAKQLSDVLGYKYFERKVIIPASLLMKIGTWKTEFAISACRHPFSAAFKELKQDADYILFALPGFDYLDGAWIKPRVLAYSALPMFYEKLLFEFYLNEKEVVLKQIFKHNFYKKYFSVLREEFFYSMKNIQADNSLDRFEIWINIQRGPFFSYMADTVENDLFEVIAPFTDTNLHNFFTRIPTKLRLMQQHSLDLFYNFYPQVRHIPFDSGRGFVTDDNSIASLISGSILKKFKNYKHSLVWNIADAIREDETIYKLIIETISSSEELKTEIFNLKNIKSILDLHYSRQKDFASLIDSLATFALAYQFFFDGKLKIPDEVSEYYKSVSATIS